MVITKDKLQQIVDHMPDHVDVQEVFDRIILSAKLEQAEKEIENGEGTDWQDLKKEMDSW
ncbi:hypothetical protein [Mucilaginibacter defluvii]|uniref:Addiction module component n=1 Tax=Mucilaginibacter defluvii TaxID=1196019 RepID=A0ABP9G203_9SPHI